MLLGVNIAYFHGLTTLWFLNVHSLFIGLSRSHLRKHLEYKQEKTLTY